MAAIPAHLRGLSSDAKAIAGGHFGFMRPGHGTLTFRTPSRITDRTKAGLAELEAAGVCTAQTEASGALIYTSIIDCRPFAGWLMRHPEAGKFSTVNPEAR